MEKISIKENARNLILRASENTITIADGIKREIETKDGISQPRIIIDNGVDYTKKQALRLVNDKTVATKWINTIDENNNEALVIVLEEEME